MATKKIEVVVLGTDGNEINIWRINVEKETVLLELKCIISADIRAVKYIDEEEDEITAKSEDEIGLAIFDDGVTKMKAIHTSFPVPKVTKISEVAEQTTHASLCLKRNRPTTAEIVDDNEKDQSLRKKKRKECVEKNSTEEKKRQKMGM